MKKFKYPLDVFGTITDLIKIYQQLEGLGYNIDAAYKRDHNSHLWTNWDGKMGFRMSFATERIPVPATNPDLVLALAAMVDDDKIHEGEHFYCFNDLLMLADKKREFTKGNLYKSETFGCLTNDSGNTHHGMAGNSGNKYIRKATKEEIINHFNKKENDMNVNDKKVSEPGEYSQQSNREIIGYKVKSGLDREAVMKLIGASSPYSFYDTRIDFQRCSMFYDKAINLCILDQLFEKVYKKEEIQFKVGDWIYVQDGGPGSQGATGIIGQVHNGHCVNGYSGEDGGIKVRTWQLNPEAKIRYATKEEIEAAQTKKTTLSCEGGTFELEVSKKGIYYRPEGRYLNINDLKYLVEVTNLPPISVSGYTFTPIVTHVDAGCKKKTLLSDLKKVIEECEKTMES